MKIIKFIFLLYIYSTLCILGLFTDEILKIIFPTQPMSVTLLLFFIIAYFSDYIIKQLFIKPSLLNIIPYINLPISKKKLYNTTIFLNAISYYNYISAIIISAISIKLIYVGSISAIGGISFCFLAIATSLFNSSIVRLIKSISIWKRLSLMVIVILSYIGIAYTSYENVLITDSIKYLANNYAIVFILTAFLLVVAYKISLERCQHLFYDVYEQTGANLSKTRSGLTELFKVSPQNKLALCLITRNKAVLPNFLTMFPAFLLNVAVGKLNDYSWFIILSGIIATNIWICLINPLFYFLAPYVDGIMSHSPRVIQDVLRRFYTINCIFSLIPMTIIIMITQDLLLSVTLYLFSISVVSLTILWSNIYATKKYDLLRRIKSSDNHKDMKVLASNMITVAIIAVWIVLDYYFPKCEVILYCIDLVSIIVILFHKSIIKQIYNGFMKRRYENLAGMRQ